MYAARQNQQPFSRLIDTRKMHERSNKCYVIQLRSSGVLDEMPKRKGFSKAKKIQSSSDNSVRWWQFPVSPSGYVNNDFTENVISRGPDCNNKKIKEDGYGEQYPIKERVNISHQNSEFFIDGHKRLTPIAQASDSAVFAAADRETEISSRSGLLTWHHAENPYWLFLLDTNVHQAFSHKGWASTHGIRSVRVFVVPDDAPIEYDYPPQWSPEEDSCLLRYVELLGKKWSVIASCMPHRSDRQCRYRYDRLQKNRNFFRKSQNDFRRSEPSFFNNPTDINFALPPFSDYFFNSVFNSDLF